MQETFKNYNESISNSFKSWADKAPFGDGYGWDRFVAANKSNAKALADVAQAISEGGQALARRQAEIIQRTADDIVKFFKESANAKSPEACIAKQADFAKSSVDSAINNSRELVEISSKLNSEARDIIGKRVANAISELTPHYEPREASREHHREPAREREAAKEHKRKGE